MPDEDIRIYVPSGREKAPEPAEETDAVRIYPDA